MSRNLDWNDADQARAFRELDAAIEKEVGVLKKQEKKARESFTQAASLYEYRDIFNDSRYIVGWVVSYEGR